MEELSERQEEKAGERNSLTHCPNGQKCSNNAENQREVEDPTIQRKSPEKRKNLQSFFFFANTDILCFCVWKMFKRSEKGLREALWLGGLP